MQTKVKAQMTPGPWHLDAQFALYPRVLDAEFNTVAEVLGYNTGANARAIAALPQLIEALQRIANEPCDHGPQDFCPRELSQAALRKAGVL